MSKINRVKIKKLKHQPCFYCGTDNPIGLNLDFYCEGDNVCSEITLSQDYEGWQGMAHGGIISGLLDEVMAWTIAYFRKTFAVTINMEVKFVRPVSIGIPLIVKGQIIDSSQEKIIKVKSEILNPQNNILAKGYGKYLILSENQLDSVPKDVKTEFIKLFKTYPS